MEGTLPGIGLPYRHFVSKLASPSGGAFSFEEHMEYPKWKYASGASLIVESAEDESALTGEWFDSPADIDNDSPDMKAAKDVLMSQAYARNIIVDKRWSIERITAALA